MKMTVVNPDMEMQMGEGGHGGHKTARRRRHGRSAPAPGLTPQPGGHGHHETHVHFAPAEFEATLLDIATGTFSSPTIVPVTVNFFVVTALQNKLCAWRHDMPRPCPPVGAQGPRAPPSRRNVAVVSHAQYVLTVTAAPASRLKAAVSKAAW